MGHTNSKPRAPEYARPCGGGYLICLDLLGTYLLFVIPAIEPESRILDSRFRGNDILFKQKTQTNKFVVWDPSTYARGGSTQVPPWTQTIADFTLTDADKKALNLFNLPDAPRVVRPRDGATGKVSLGWGIDFVNKKQGAARVEGILLSGRLRERVAGGYTSTAK